MNYFVNHGNKKLITIDPKTNIQLNKLYWFFSIRSPMAFERGIAHHP